jgi:hypothetical protein
MADWTTIPDSSIEPGKPIRSIDGLALRDNPVAIAEGAVGAPKIAAAALKTGNNERDWVLARTSAADVGAVGTYAFLGSTNLTAVAPGSTKAGSSLRYASVLKTTSTWSGTTPDAAYGIGTTTTPSGTWRCMGIDGSGSYGTPDVTNCWGATLWLRIA